MKTLDSFFKKPVPKLQSGNEDLRLVQRDEKANVPVVALDDDILGHENTAASFDSIEVLSSSAGSFDNSSHTPQQDNRKAFNLKSFLNGKHSSKSDKTKNKKKNNTNSTASLPLNTDDNQRVVHPDFNDSTENFLEDISLSEPIEINNSFVIEESKLEDVSMVIDPDFQEVNISTNSVNIIDQEVLDPELTREMDTDMDFSQLDPELTREMDTDKDVSHVDPDLTKEMDTDMDFSLVDPDLFNESVEYIDHAPALSQPDLMLVGKGEIKPEKVNSKILRIAKSQFPSAKPKTQPKKQFPNKPVTSLSSLLSGGPKKIHRLNKISLEKSIPCDQFPKIQSVFPTESSYPNQIIPNLLGSMKFNRKPQNNMRDEVEIVSTFQPAEYQLLNENDKPAININTWDIPTQHSTKQWDTLFKPQSIEELVLDRTVVNEFRDYLTESFQKLSKPTTRLKLKNYKKLLQSADFVDEMADFIVQDDDYYGSQNTAAEQDTMEDYVPIIILYGDAVGKNCLINTVLEDMDVFEINSSMNRGRKQIMDMCSEVVTTQFVNQQNDGGDNVLNNNTNASKQGVVLFDDVDVLFKKKDKNFWLVVNRLLEISRRPIILTCKTLSAIPKNILAVCGLENGIFQLNKLCLKSYVSYLSKKLDSDFPRDVIERILVDNKCDIRQALLQLQYISTLDRYTIQTAKDTNFEKENEPELTKISEYYDTVSQCDLMLHGVKYRSAHHNYIDPTLHNPDMNNEYGIFVNFPATSNQSDGPVSGNVTKGNNNTLSSNKSITNLMSNVQSSRANDPSGTNGVDDDDSGVNIDSLVNSIPSYVDTETSNILSVWEYDRWKQLFHSLNVYIFDDNYFEEQGNDSTAELKVPNNFVESCEFLSTRINRFESKRSTRNKRKYKEILSTLNNTLEDDDFENEYKKKLMIDHPSWNEINTYILPTISLLASSEVARRKENWEKLLELRKIYENYTDEEILKYMEEEKMLKRLYFAKVPASSVIY